MIKKHWPVFTAILVLIISMILEFAASKSTDTGVVIFVGLVIYMLLLPVAGALIGGWYGWMIRSPLKWLLAPAVYLGTVLYLLAEGLLLGAGSMDAASLLSVGSFTGLACLIVEIVSSAVSWLVRRKKENDQGE